MAQRKRASGFALMDAAFAADAKFVRLARHAKTPMQFAAAVGVFWLILADARRAKSCEVNWDDYSEYATQVKALQAAQLLTSEGFDGTTFDRWAPAYKAPSEVREGTNGYEEVQKVRAATDTSGRLSSIPVSEGEDGGVGEEGDAATFACGFFPNAGEWLMKRDYTSAWDELERRFGEWVKPATQAAYTELIAKGSGARPWDLKRLTELRLAERVRRDERGAEEARKQRVRDEQAAREAVVIAPEERERQALMRRAVKVWATGAVHDPVPESVEDLRAWLADHESVPTDALTEVPWRRPR